MKSCVAANPCNRVNTAFPEHLPFGFAQELAWRIAEHFEKGDLDTAESFAHLLNRHLHELGKKSTDDHVEQLEDSAWMAEATILLARINIARDHLIEARDMFMHLVRTIAEVSGQGRYQAEYCDALFGAMRCLYLEQDRSGFNRLFEIYENTPAPCFCVRQVQLGILRGLKGLRDHEYVQALLAFKSVEKYRLVSPFAYAVSVMGLAEVSIHQKEDTTALTLVEQLNHQFTIGNRGALFGWRNFFPSVIEFAHQYNMVWPVVPMPFSELGNTLQQPKISAKLELHAFGPGELKVYRSKMDGFASSPVLKTLLTYLAMHPNGVTLEDLRMELWLGTTNNDTVHRMLSKLRSSIGEEHIIREDGIYKIATPLWLDVIEFERLYTQVQKAKHAIEVIPEIRAAMSIYSMPFLADVLDIAWVRQSP